MSSNSQIQDEKQAAASIRMYNHRAVNYNSSWHPSFAATFASMLPLSPGQRVLDLACGTGLLSFDEGVLVGPTGQVVGVDVTPGMLKEALERKKVEGDSAKNIEFHQCDVMALESLAGVQKESFDAVTMASALVLFDDPAAVIRVMKSYAKPGGVIAVDCTHPRDLLGGMLVEKAARKMGVKMPYYRTWADSENSLRELLEKEGLVVEKYRFVEQRGFGKRYYDVGQADQVFDEMLEGQQLWPIKQRGHEAVLKAKELFRKEWEDSAVDGKVEEYDGVYVAVARKPVDQGAADQGDVVLTGGCRCGSVRFTSSKLPQVMEACHCFTCGRLSGCGFLPFFELPKDAVRYISSKSLKSLNITDSAKRTFCGACGAPISMEYHSSPDGVAIVAGTVDLDSVKGELPKLSMHIFLKEKLSWDIIPDDGAKRYDGFP